MTAYSPDTEDLLTWIARIGYGPLADALRDDDIYMLNGRLSIRRLSKKIGVCDGTVNKQLSIIRQMWDEQVKA